MGPKKKDKRRKVITFAEEELATEEPETDEGFLLIDDIEEYKNDIITVVLPRETQEQFMCEKSVDLFIDKPWKTILKSIALQVAHKKGSGLRHYAQTLENYPYTDILIGYEPFSFKADPNAFLICVTERGRNRVLGQLKQLRTSYIESVDRANSLQPRAWQSLGSEDEIGIDKDVNNRPLISFEWVGKVIERVRGDPLFQPMYADKAKYGYTCVINTRHTYDLVEKFTSEIGCQAIPHKKTVESQTVAEIPVNASTQYRPEDEIPVNEGFKNLEQATNVSNHIKLYINRVLEAVTYNQEYDLYKDDYRSLSSAGKSFDVIPNLVYKHYLSFNDVLSIEGKVITGTSWHPTLTGVVAASYGEDVPSKIVDLDSNSDDTDYEPEDTDSDREEVVETKETIDVERANEWMSGADEYSKPVSEENTQDWDRATNTLLAIERSKELRNCQISLALKDEDEVPEVEALEKVDVVEYKVFEDLGARMLRKRLKVVVNKYETKKRHERRRLEKERVSELKRLLGILKKKKRKKKKKREKKEKVKGEKDKEKKKKKASDKQGEKKSDLKNKAKGAKEKGVNIGFRLDLPEEKPKSIFNQAADFGTNMQFFGNVFTSNDETFDSVWGANHEWFLGDQMKIIAYNIHRKYKEESVQVKGNMPEGPFRERPHKLIEPPQPDSMSLTSGSQVTSTMSLKSQRTYRTTLSRQPHMSRASFLSTRSKLSKTTTDSKTPTKEHVVSQFTELSDEDEDMNEEAMYADDELFPVLIWCFQNDLSPVLRLDSPYEIRCVNFCPHNGNIIVGGAVTGQLVMWDITGKLNLTGNVPKDTHTQEARKTMEKLMKWRRDIRIANRVAHTALSSRGESHKEKVVNLLWVHPCLEISPTGRFVPLPDGAPLSMQVMSSSEDGTIKFWDLRETLNLKGKGGEKVHRKRFSRPALLLQGISPFTYLDKKWSPIYTVHCRNEKLLPVQISCVAFEKKPVKYKRKTLTKMKQKMEDIVEYKYVPTSVPPVRQDAFIGTMEGLVGYISWEGQASEKKATNFEDATVNMFQPFHDGPITCLARHPFLPHVCLSTGGHTFAIWHIDDLSWPIKWHRYYGVKLTACSWSPLRPSLFRIARTDGTVEIWDLMLQSHAQKINIAASGRVITAMSSPGLPLPKGLLGIADHNASLRLYYIPWMYQVWTKEELDRLEKFVNNEPLRKNNMREWIAKWNRTHIKRRKTLKLKHVEKIDLEEMESKEVGVPSQTKNQLTRYRNEVYKWYLRRRGKQSAWLDESWKKWYAKEEAHMVQTLLANKNWNQRKMDRVMKPLLTAETLARERHIKVEELLAQADNIFQAAAATIFVDRNTIQQASLISVRVGYSPLDDVEDAYKEVELLFGEHYEEIEEEYEGLLKDLKWADEVPVESIAVKYKELREVFNDRRRWRDPKLKWLRMKIKSDLEDSGYIYTTWENRKDKYYQLKKIKRRMTNIEYLRNLYGEDYDPYWDVQTFQDELPLLSKFPDQDKRNRKGAEWLDSIASGGAADYIQQRYKLKKKMLEEREREKRAKELAAEEPEEVEEEVIEEETKELVPPPVKSTTSVHTQKEESLPSIKSSIKSKESEPKSGVSSVEKLPSIQASVESADRLEDFDSSDEELQEFPHIGEEIDTQDYTPSYSSSTSDDEAFYEGKPVLARDSPPRRKISLISLVSEDPDPPEESEEEVVDRGEDEGEGDEDEGGSRRSGLEEPETEGEMGSEKSGDEQHAVDDEID